MAAHHDSAVFLGRGAQFFLPRDRGLAVRIGAPLERRIRWVAQQQQIEYRQAAQMVEQSDRERRDFVQHYFHRDTTDLHLYDLAINLDRVRQEDAVDLIADQYRRQFGEQG